MRFVDGSYAAPSETIKENNKEIQNPTYLSCVEMDQKVLLIVQSSLSEEAMAKVIGLTYSRAVWLALETAYSHDSVKQSQNRKDFLRQLKKGNLSISEFAKSSNIFVINLQLSGNWRKVTNCLFHHYMVPPPSPLPLMPIMFTGILVEGGRSGRSNYRELCSFEGANSWTGLIRKGVEVVKKMALVPVKEAGSMSYQVPVLTATNYPVWAVKVKSIMDAYGLWGTVEPRTLGEEPDEKKSKQALAFLFQAIPEDMVLQMVSYTDPKQVWDGLKTRFLGVDRVRTDRLATLNRELESLRMKEGESVDDFASKLTDLASKARSLGYELEEVDLVKRLLDSMPKSFLQIVASIEQCFELDSMLFDEVVGRLKVYEERIKGAEKMEDTQGGLLLASDGK
ncbi:putative zinc finger, CCHC-type containing protein [Tanacetum coccineum]